MGGLVFYSKFVIELFQRPRATVLLFLHFLRTEFCAQYYEPKISAPTRGSVQLFQRFLCTEFCAQNYEPDFSAATRSFVQGQKHSKIVRRPLYTFLHSCEIHNTRNRDKTSPCSSLSHASGIIWVTIHKKKRLWQDYYAFISSLHITDFPKNPDNS